MSGITRGTPLTRAFNALARVAGMDDSIDAAFDVVAAIVERQGVEMGGSTADVDVGKRVRRALSAFEALQSQTGLSFLRNPKDAGLLADAQGLSGSEEAFAAYVTAEYPAPPTPAEIRAEEAAAETS